MSVRPSAVRERSGLATGFSQKEILGKTSQEIKRINFLNNRQRGFCRNCLQRDTKGFGPYFNDGGELFVVTHSYVCVFKFLFSVGFFFNILSCNGSAITNLACKYFWYLFVKFVLPFPFLHSLCHKYIHYFVSSTYFYWFRSASYTYFSLFSFFALIYILGEEEMDVDVGMGDGGSVLPTASGN